MREWGLTVWLLILTGLTASCGGGSIDAEFTKKEKEWLVYEQEDTLLFRSPNRDTLQTVVEYISEASQVSKRYPIEAEVMLKGNAGKELFRIYLLKDEQNFKKYIRLGQVYRSLDLVQPQDSVEINNHFYNNVYELQQDTSKSNVSIWRVFYNKKHGFLKFETKEEEAYELVNRLPSS